MALQALLLVLVGSLPSAVTATPLSLPPRSLIPVTVDFAQDVWAEALSGVTPLILLVGERSTRQLLRNVRSVWNGFSLAAAPLGLIAVVTGLIRLCGVRRLRASIGYELEARAVPGIEMTRANCGGVRAEVVDGYIVRTTASKPVSQAVAVAMVDGDIEAKAEEVLLQIQACDRFAAEKKRWAVPDQAGPVRWCLQMTAASSSGFDVRSALQVVGKSLGVTLDEDAIEAFRHVLSDGGAADCGLDDEKQLGSSCLSRSPVMASSSWNTGASLDNGLRKTRDLNTDSDVQHHDGCLHDLPGTSRAAYPVVGHITFLCTLEAISEFFTSQPIPRPLAFLLGFVSAISILALQILAIWQLEWRVSIGWILMFLGYIGIMLGVLVSSMLIHATCICIPFRGRSSRSQHGWVNGIVLADRNTDSMDTTGSDFLRSQEHKEYLFEAVWMQHLSGARRAWASLVALFLICAFVAHYLGLRTVQWWVAVGELALCLIAALGRSITNDRQAVFTRVPDVKLDKRCSSTGIIRVQRASLIPTPRSPPAALDFRAYSPHPAATPAAVEHMAWHAAQFCLAFPETVAHLLELTGMALVLLAGSPSGPTCAIMATFRGGLVVKEGLAYPNARLVLGFQCSAADLAAPTALLARAVMRQPEWYITRPDLSQDALQLGSQHVPAISSVVDWWTLSEDRNDLYDLARNLQAAFFLINIAFFLALGEAMGESELKAVARMHAGAGEDVERVGKEAGAALRRLLAV